MDGRPKASPGRISSATSGTDLSDRERLVVVFGMRAVEIEGTNLGVLVAEIREGLAKQHQGTSKRAGAAASTGQSR